MHYVGQRTGFAEGTVNGPEHAPILKREDLLAKVQKRFGASPLWEVAQALEDAIADRAVRVADLEKFVRRTLDALPSSFGRRFAFDAAMIQDIADGWSSQALQLSQMILPVFGKGWAYSRQPMHPHRQPTRFVELIHLPGDDSLSDVKLLSYPWLCHELGHLVLSHRESTFEDSFGATLQVALAAIGSGADGESGQPDKAALRETEKCWAPAPSPDHAEDWANECAADVVALWTCGPAFIASMERTVANGEVDPYSIEAPHPPYEVRLSAVVRGARLLGWAQAIPGIEAIARRWKKGRGKVNLPPHYACLTHPTLIEGAVWAALRSCQTLRLPLCTAAVVDAVGKGAGATAEPDFGTDLLLAARLTHDSKGPEAYEAWQTQTVTELAEQVTLDQP